MDGMAPHSIAADAAEAAPDSWETADLEAQFSKLKRPSENNDTSAPDTTGNNTHSFPAETLSAYGAARSHDQAFLERHVDSFLLDAVQTGRDRLTILRMEQDIERFVKSSNMQQFEFAAELSSYQRLAAHRVAQHYGLQSLATDVVADDGVGRVIARRTAETRLPKVRLMDIQRKEDGDWSNLQQKQVRLQIKQRAVAEDGRLSDSRSQESPLKTVEERKEEYERARARIFNAANGSSSRDVEAERAAVEASSAQSSRSASPVLVDNGATSNTDGKQRKSNRVAVFRDRDKDRRDPDYDRYRYTAPRYDGGYQPMHIPYAYGGMYGPGTNYNADFPQLGAHPQMVDASGMVSWDMQQVQAQMDYHNSTGGAHAGMSQFYMPQVAYNPLEAGGYVHPEQFQQMPPPLDYRQQSRRR
eukprot:jgi/Chlat1/7649/Chrsp64S07122